MDRKTYLKEVERRLSQIFSASKNGYKTSDTERHRLEGFMQAGIFTGLSTNAEMRALMEATHQSIFNKSIQSRKAELASKWQGDAIDYSQYEQPTFERGS